MQHKSAKAAQRQRNAAQAGEGSIGLAEAAKRQLSATQVGEGGTGQRKAAKIA
jgi:hypothetical protein